MSLAWGVVSCLALAGLAFEPGDRIAVIGNALPDRMQHAGWFESYLQGANAGKDLIVRDMGFGGDQAAARPREQGFPSPEAYLTLVQADVVLAFFGYNESWARDPEVFKGELRSFADATLGARYNGASAPRLVLFSPIAFEDLGSKDLPDGVEHNRWLSIYTDAMARVAQEKGVPFVDLYAPTKALFDSGDVPMTINGVHLNEAGNKAVARIAVEALGYPIVEDHAEKIRAAVLDKNWCWFNRYRAPDGNDVHGSRAELKFVDGQTNAEVLQHELIMLDAMAASRDRVIWQAAQGVDAAPDDSTVPDPIQVKSSLSQAGGDGNADYVPDEKGVSTLTLEAGLEANLFASEAMFPELVNPVQMDVDTKGRIWIAAWQTYPKWQPDHEMLDRLLILPDDDHDGVADRAIAFAEVHNPTGFTFWNGGVVVCSAPNIWFLKDTDGDDVADFKEILFTGLDSADTHHSPNGFDYGPDGYIYYQRGVFNVSNVETPWGPAVHSGRSGMYRFNPRTHRFAFHADNEPNAHGGDFDYWGYHFATDATGGRAYQVRMARGGRFRMHELLKKTVRPVPSSGVLSSRHFPPAFEGNYLILNAIGFLGIKRYTLENKDGEMWGTEAAELLVSSDPNFRPTDFKIGDDGALYVSDWQNAIIGHMQHNIRDPERDDRHGRVYRITASGRPLQERTPVDGQPIAALLELLKHPVNGVRLRARIELSEHPADAVMAALAEWMKPLDGTGAADAHPLLEALWLHQQFNVVNEGLLTVLLNSPQPDARRAAERVKYLWEIEGQIGAESGAMYEAMAHAHHAPEEDAAGDYLKQEPSPAPKLEGDTMVVHIQTLKEQMKYDRKAFAVKPGMKVKVVFKNPDAMDHNMIFVMPGAAPQVAMAAMMLGKDGPKKDWRPESDRIVAASKVLFAGESTTLEFAAPAAPGAYDYICTYPGHWMLMNGVMHVVEDIDAWNAANPDQLNAAAAGAASHEWKTAELLPHLDKLERGRSLERGAEVFKTASCGACHLPAPNGARVGPDLAGNAERLAPEALLAEILDPSAVVKPEYQSWRVNVATGDPFADGEFYGLIAEQNDAEIRLLTNPLTDPVGQTIARKDIAALEPAPLSAMPTGLLNAFSREDLLDLLAYVRSLRAPAPAP